MNMKALFFYPFLFFSISVATGAALSEGGGNHGVPLIGRYASVEEAQAAGRNIIDETIAKKRELLEKEKENTNRQKDLESRQSVILSRLASEEGISKEERNSLYKEWGETGKGISKLLKENSKIIRQLKDLESKMNVGSILIGGISVLIGGGIGYGLVATEVVAVGGATNGAIAAAAAGYVLGGAVLGVVVVAGTIFLLKKLIG